MKTKRTLFQPWMWCGVVLALSVLCGKAAPTITNSNSLPTATAGVAYSVTLMATGGVAPYHWIVASGKLPSGLTLNTNTGVLSGMPASAGAYNFQAQVTSANSSTAQKTFTLNVGMGAPVREAVSAFLSTPASNSLYTIPVVIVRFLPTANGVDLDVTKAPDFWSLNPITLSAMKGNIDAFTDRVKFGLEQGTRFRAYKDTNALSSLGYQVVDVLTFYEHTPASSFTDPYDTNQIHYLDYGQIMQAINGSNYVNNLGVHEFWVWHGSFDDTFPSYRADSAMFNLDDARAFQESNMSSPTTGDVSNSHLFDDLPIYSKTYTVYEYSIRRTHALALHNHGHQIESLMDYYYWQQDGNSHFFWNKFVGNDSLRGGYTTGLCGWTHAPPNTVAGNNDDWFNPAVVMSDIQDWRPDGSGTSQPFGTNTFWSVSYAWPGGYTPALDSADDDQAMWLLFWWQSMPGFKNGIPNGTNGIPNWWVFTADWDDAITGRAVPPVITAGPTNCVVSPGESATFSVTASSLWTPAKYQWMFNGQSIAGATNSSLTLTGVTYAQEGSYSVEVYNLAGATTSTPTLLTAFNNMVWIPAGTFLMGSPTSEVDRFYWESPQTQVTISSGFYLDKYPVTQRDYLALMGNNPAHFTGDLNRPVESITWFDATNYCIRLTAQERAAGRLPVGYYYTLPTEAQWEYACRAGTITRFSYGDDPGYTLLPQYAWFSSNSGNSTQPVGTKLPNPWGLYDMGGNVSEWCLDWHGLYPGGSVIDPQGPSTGSTKQIRGGDRSATGPWCRSASRNDAFPTSMLNTVGFRLALIPAVGPIVFVPVIQNATLAKSNGTFNFSWNATAGTTYQVQYKTNLNQSAWLNLGNPITNASGTVTAADGVTNAQRFYRVMLQP